MEERESRTRFKLVHVVMPHQWLKQIKKSYRRKRAVRGDGDADSATTSSCETSFESSSLFQPHLGPSDAARSLIDVAFPLSPKALRLTAYSNQLSPSVAMSPLRYTVSPSPASGSSPPSRFYPSPCRYPPSPTRKMLFPTRGIDIPYPISPRKPSVVVSIQTPSPATRFLTGVRTVKNVEELLPPPPSPPRFSTASAPDRSDYNKAPQSTALLQRSRSARSSLFACFTDDFRLPESATKVEDKEAAPSYLPRLGGSARGAARDFHNQVVPLSPSDHGGIMRTEQKQHQQAAESGGGGRGKTCTCAPGGSDYCAACSSRESAAVTSGRAGNLLSKSARHSGTGSSSRREARAGRGSSTHHRRVLSLSCISNAARNSPDGQEMLASASLSSSFRRADIGEQVSQAAAPAVKPAPGPAPAAAAGEWPRETSWNVLAELDNEVVRRRVVLRKRVQSVSHGVQLQQNVMYDPEASSFGFRSASLEELQGASQKRLVDTGFVDGVDTCGSFRLSTSSVDVNAEHNVVPWDKDFSSATSEDPESLFTPFEVDSACVTPGATSSSSATGFGNSIKASRLAAVSNANPHADRSPSAAWTVPFIPEECEAACPSPEDSDVEPAEDADEQSCRVSDESGQASDVAEVDSEEEDGSLRSSARYDTKSCSSSSRQGDGALTEDEHDDGRDDDDDVGGDDEEEDEGESGGQSWDEMEAWPPSPVVEEDEYEDEDEDEDELKEGEEWNASSSMQEAWPELRFRCRDAGEQTCDDNQSEMDCSSSIDDACAMEQAQQQCDESESKGGAAAAGPGRWTDGLQSLLDGRLFPSSEDEMAVLNKPDSNEGQLQVSDESCDERDWQCRGSDTPERREASPHLRRKTARSKTKHVSGTPRAMSMAVDRKPAADPARRSEEIARRKAKLAEGRRESFVPAVDLPAEIRGRVRESVPVVTHSYDPYTDFRDSMVEMILEKDILDSQDLEDLLHAYLALNRGEFHGLIVEVFTDLWYEIFDAGKSAGKSQS